jgi:hypothetical protein
MFAQARETHNQNLEADAAGKSKEPIFGDL